LAWRSASAGAGALISFGLGAAEFEIPTGLGQPEIGVLLPVVLDFTEVNGLIAGKSATGTQSAGQYLYWGGEAVAKGFVQRMQPTVTIKGTTITIPF